MKTLPDRPNLDHLHKQAKDHQKELRRSDPSVTLTAAQASLAQQYGFATWPELKAEVDLRLGRIEHAPDTLTAALAKQFDLGLPLSAMTSAARAPMAREWQLTTDRGRWLLVQEIDWSPWDDISDELRLVEAALAAGVDCDRPIQSSSGAAIETVDGVRWRAFEWVDTGPGPTLPVPVRVAADVGRMLGRLHGLALTTNTPMTPWLTWRRPANDWEALLDRARAEQVPWVDAFAGALPALLEVNALAVPDRLPPMLLCHRNINVGSVRFNGARDLFVSCWEHAGPLPPAWELASVLTEWCERPGDGYDLDVARGLVDGYRDTAGSAPTLTLSDFSSAISGLLNWTSTRISIALDPREPGEQRQMATKEVPGLLATPLSVDRLQGLIDAVSQ